VAGLLEPAETTLVVALTVLALAGAVLAAVQWLLACPTPRPGRSMSYARIALVNGIGLAPLLVAAVRFAGAR
jgi:hypothetical protein